MQGKSNSSQNRLTATSNFAQPPGADRFRDVWDASGSCRTLVDASSGARTTFTYDGPSHTVIQFPTGRRITLAWCRSQMSTAPARLSQFAAHLELRSESRPSFAETRATVLTHPESQRHISGVANGALRTLSKRRRWLDDVVQQANLQLLADIRQGKLEFDGDDPERFVRWFRGVSRHAVADAIKFCFRAFAALEQSSETAEIADRRLAEPADVAMLRELARLAGEQIGRIRETKLREVMWDLRDGTSIRVSARRLGISKSRIDRMRKRGCRLIAARLGT